MDRITTNFIIIQTFLRFGTFRDVAQHSLITTKPISNDYFDPNFSMGTALGTGKTLVMSIFNYTQIVFFV